MLLSCCTFCSQNFKKYFVDLQFMGILMSIWLLVVLFVLFELGVFAQTKFVAFGPRADLTFMHVAIDTYYKYNMLICMIVVHTFVTDIIADSLAPHVLNVVQDNKNKYIPHRARTYLLITTMWSIYCSVSQLIVIFIAFGQLDLLLVRLASDLIANFTTLNMYLDGKIYDPLLHAQVFLCPTRAGGEEEEDCGVRRCKDQDTIVLFSIHDEAEEEEEETKNLNQSNTTSKNCTEEGPPLKGHAMEKEMIMMMQRERQQEICSDLNHEHSAASKTTDEDEKQALLSKKK
jgi:hypothetical protein